MRTPIAYALGWPDRLKTPGETLDLLKIGSLNFEEPDTDRFPALGMAYDALIAGTCHCIALNASNEIAVEAFLNQEIGFSDIMRCVGNVLEQVDEKAVDALEDVFELDHNYRALARNALT